MSEYVVNMLIVGEDGSQPTITDVSNDIAVDSILGSSMKEEILHINADDELCISDSNEYSEPRMIVKQIPSSVIQSLGENISSQDAGHVVYDNKINEKVFTSNNFSREYTVTLEKVLSDNVKIVESTDDFTQTIEFSDVSEQSHNNLVSVENIEINCDRKLIKPCERCRLCQRFVHAGNLQDGKQISSPDSNNNLLDILCLAVDMTLKISGQTWSICESCISLLVEADQVMARIKEIKASLSKMIQRRIVSKSSLNQETKNNLVNNIPKKNYPTFSNSALNLNAEGKKINCPLCEKFITKSYWMMHLKIVHTKTEPIICKRCVREYPNEAHLGCHIRSVHPNLKIADVCYNTDIETKVTGKPKTRKEKLHKKGNCPICSVEINAMYIKRHLQEVHGDKKQYKCKFCDEGFVKQCHRRLHMKRIHGVVYASQKELKCDQCPKVFKGADKLQRHIEGVHEQRRNFKCDICPLAFKTNSGLVLHKRGHTDERPFVCTVCDKAFRRSGSCRKHLSAAHGFVTDVRLNDPLERYKLPMIKLPTKPD